MKVQRKGEHEQCEVIEQSDKYYIVQSKYGKYTLALPKADYEPVQEWVPLYSTFIALDISGYDLRAVNDGGVLTVEGKRKR